MYTFVKTIPIESFGDYWEKSRNIGKVIPYLLEYLLVDHELVILVGCNELLSETTIPKILKAVAIHGEVIVPPSDYVGRITRFHPVTAETQFPLLAYTRAGYSKSLKPLFDCRRGLWCQSGEHRQKALTDARPSPVLPGGSVLKRGSVGLNHGGQPEDALSLQMEPQFELISPQLGIPVAPHTIRIGLGLEFIEGETASDFIEKKLIPLFRSLEGQDRAAYYILLYVNILTESTLRAELVRGINSTQLPKGLSIKVGLTPILTELSDLVFETAAWKDSCEHFVSLGTPLALPQLPWLARVSKGFSLHKPDRLVLVTIVNSSDDLWMLKELVGSVHNLLGENLLDPSALLIALGSAAIKKCDVATIRLWENVEYYDLDELLFGLPLPMHERIEDEELVRLMVLDKFTKQHGAAVWVKQGVFFSEPLEGGPSPLVQLNADLISKGLVRAGDDESMVVEGYNRNAFIQLFGDLQKCVVQLDCDSSIAEYRKVSSLVRLEKYNLQSLLPRPTDLTKRGRMHCYLSLRPEIMYTPQLLKKSREQISQWASLPEDAQIWKLSMGERKRVAFLIPSKSGPHDSPDKVHLLQTFFRSMLNSISADEWLHYQYAIYVGYDEDDPVLDRRRSDLLKEIDKMRGEAHRRNVLFKFHRLPAARCVTLFWNLLFLDAIADGNDYFYQVNDDVTLLDTGWTSKFVTKLQGSDGFGVTGPNDQLWSCRLLTQSFVSRRHWEIFGWYFPIVIKDWYSDNWISEVYGPDHTYCIRDAAIRNGATSTRYNICDRPKWRSAIEEGKSTIEQWKRRQVIKLRAKREGP